MKIAGLQKVSTIDYVGEICCVVFLWGCNFRCGFCHNPDLVIRAGVPEFSQEGVLNFLSKRMGKLDAVCISGGEPLMTLDMDFVRRVKSMGFKVKIDTNGSFPGRLRELIAEELVDYIAMDVKSCREEYCEVVNREIDLGDIEESIKIVNDFGQGKTQPRTSIPVSGTRTSDEADERGLRSEFRTTVVPGLHDARKLARMGEWMGEVCGGKPGQIFLQGFKRGENMIDSGFMERDEIFKEGLLKLKDSVEGLFCEVGVRH